MLSRLIAVAIAAAGTMAMPAQADPVAEFYSGNRITFVVGTGAGGGYGMYAELLAKHLPQYIPGEPAITIQYMPGAGGVTATTYMYRSAARDGTVIATLTQSNPLYQVLNDVDSFDAAALTYIGRMATANAAGLVWSETGVASLDDMSETPIVFGGTGRGDQSYMFPTILRTLFGFDTRTVLGYSGSGEMNLAIERREVDGRVGSWTSLKNAVGPWLDDGRIVPVLEVGLESSPDLAGVVPLVTDLARDDEELALLRLLSSYAAIGRAISSAPEVPEERLEALRTAFDMAISDPALLAEAAELGLPIEPLTGAEVADIVSETVGAPAELVARARELLEY